MKLAGLKQAAVIVEIMNDDGTMAKGKDLKKFAEKNDVMIVSIDELIEEIYSSKTINICSEGVFDCTNNTCCSSYLDPSTYKYVNMSHASPLEITASSLTYPLLNMLPEPNIIKVNYFDDRVEVIYRCEPDMTMTLTTWPPKFVAPNIYKIITSIKDGKLVQTRETATYTPAQPESYEFSDKNNKNDAACN
jgi:hypothetical protein